MRRRVWRPNHTREVWRPEVGDLIGLEHQVWRVVEVRDRPEVDWNDDERARVAEVKRESRHKYLPFTVVARRADGRGKDRHMSYGGRHIGTWSVYVDEHYPVCAKCGEPTPCRERLAAEDAAIAMGHMARYESTDHCPACNGVITDRQRSVTFEENLVVPLGPPVTFHIRQSCRHAAAEYEKKLAAGDPTRKLVLSCRGDLMTHGDETYECTAGDECPGPMTFHRAYVRCDCCPKNRDCRPWAHYRRRVTPSVLDRHSDGDESQGSTNIK